MEYEDERRFVEAFVRENRRERLLHELTAPKKRYRALSRFCHQAEELLDPDRIVMAGEDLERREEFQAFVRAHDAPCRVLSPELGGEPLRLPLSEAAAYAAFSADAVLILGDGFAVVFGEAMKGGRDKYLLVE